MKKKLMNLFLVGLLALALLGCNQTTTNADGSRTENFTWWNGKGEDVGYYASYDQNPVVEYLCTMPWNQDENGNNIYLDFEFQTPVTGQEQNNFVTMISTGTYLDVMDMSFSSGVGTVVDLYEEGIALDLTDYVNTYMPNYIAFLDAHPEYKQTAMNVVDGETKFLQLFNYHDAVEQWGGWSYRRDWILEYGVNSDTQAPFTGGWNEDKTVWTDDIVFPSGETDPLTITDWEWMLQIFEDAVDDQNIIGGYPMSLYYPGYIATGDLTNAFGGSAAMWYIDDDMSTVKFGATETNFRVYLQCLNTWYANGWIDEAFTEHTAELFYQTDQTKVAQGKVGLWYGGYGKHLGKLDISDGEPNSPTNGYTNGICVYPAASPINDIYGGAEQQGVTPFCLYQVSLEFNPIIVTSAAEGKDLVALFKMFDYLYSEEGSMTASYGLTQEQYELTQNELMTRLGLTDGAYEPIETESGTQYRSIGILSTDMYAKNAVILNRMFCLQTSIDKYLGDDPAIVASQEQWLKYTNTGYIRPSLSAQMSSDNMVIYSRTQTNVNEFMTKTVPSFINGTKDPYSDADWNAFVSAVNKYNPQRVVTIYQELIDGLNG